MKQFDYNKYLKNNPLLKESDDEARVVGEEQVDSAITDVRNGLKIGDIVKYDGDRYIIINRIDDELVIRPLRNPYGGSYHSSPMSYPTLKIRINNPKLELFS